MNTTSQPLVRIDRRFAKSKCFIRYDAENLDPKKSAIAEAHAKEITAALREAFQNTRSRGSTAMIGLSGYASRLTPEAAQAFGKEIERIFEQHTKKE